jgi:hypothetical protein
MVHKKKSDTVFRSLEEVEQKYLPNMLKKKVDQETTTSPHLALRRGGRRLSRSRPVTLEDRKKGIDAAGLVLCAV